MQRTIRLIAYSFAFTAFFTLSALAKSIKSDQAVPPPAVPVSPVNESALEPSSVEGTGAAIDGDSLRVGDSLVRIYGISAPGVSEKFGPQARMALDNLVSGQRVSCKLFGKAPGGGMLGQCEQGAADIADKMLGQGMAAVYRAGPPQADLAARYDAAEADARHRGAGIWAKAAAQPDMQAADYLKTQALSFAAFALLLIAIFTVSITQVSIARTDRREHARLRHARRYTLSTGLAAEVEIIRAAALGISEWVKEQPRDQPVSSVKAATLALPSATFWAANVGRLYVLPVEVGVPLLRFHALHEDAARKLAIAGSLPIATVAGALDALAAAASRSIVAIEHSLGIEKKLPEPPKVENPTAT